MKKRLSLLLALAMVLSLAYALPLAQAEEGEAPVVLTWYYGNGQQPNWGTDEISQEFTRRTGIALEMTRRKTEDNEQLNLMLASNDLPDMVCVDTDNTIRTTIRDSGMFQDLKPLIDQYVPEFWDQMGDNYWEYWSSPIDGKNYFYANCTFTELTSPKYLGFGPWNGVILVRNDIYEEMGRPPMSNADDLRDTLIRVTKEYPDMIPLFMGNNSTNFDLLSGYNEFGYFQRSFGIERFYEDEEGHLKAPISDPKYVDFMLWLNELYREGVISRESFTWTKEQRDAIRDNGQAFAYSNNATDIGRVPAGKPDTFYEPIDPWPTLKMTQQTGMSWMSTFITNNCSNPEAAIRFLQYASSDEGDKLLQWGIEGRDWEYDADGNPQITAEAIEKRSADWDSYTRESGYRIYNFGINFADHVIEYHTFISNPLYKAAWEANKNYSFAKLYMMSNNPDAGTTESVLYQQISDRFRQTYPEIIMAESTDEARTMYEAMVKDLYSMDLAMVEAAWDAKAQRTKDIFGAENSVFYGIGMEGYSHVY